MKQSGFTDSLFNVIDDFNREAVPSGNHSW
jgi:hypothetical protein